MVASVDIRMDEPEKRSDWVIDFRNLTVLLFLYIIYIPTEGAEWSSYSTDREAHVPD